MELRTLRYFLAVAREENMTRAAQILHVTQPTLSKALRALEDELGKKLFERHSFSISLTDEGVLLRNRAEDLIAMADKIEGEFYWTPNSPTTLCGEKQRPPLPYGHVHAPASSVKDVEFECWYIPSGAAGVEML